MYVSKENNDVMMRFMHPKNLNNHYFWPSKDDECWIPVEDILKILSNQVLDQQLNTILLIKRNCNLLSICSL